jgi:putative heme degradation protein
MVQPVQCGVQVSRVSATLKTLTSTTDNIGGIRQITAEDVAVGTQIHKYTNTNIQIHKYTNTNTMIS